MTIRSPLRWLAYAAGLASFVLIYHQLVDRSVSRHRDVIVTTVQQYCRSAIAARHRASGGSERETALEEMTSEWKQCDDIRIESIAASGGIANPVVVRVVLDGGHYRPEGKRALVFKAADFSLPFLSSLSRLASGQWSFNPHTSYSDLTYYGAI
jgi:hypothetical protein